jgi:hypothetical protein
MILGILFLSLGACFTPDVQEGLACSESGSCPFGQVCVESVCILAGTSARGSDAGETVIRSDATSFDGDTSCQSGAVLCGDECLPQCITEISIPGESTYQPQTGCSYLRVHAWGAGGGHGNESNNAAAGGYAMVEREVSSTDSFTVIVGAPGGNAVGATAGLGGTPGGGNGGQGDDDGGGGGGGYSGLFSGGTAAINAIVIAGAGGGSGGGNSFPENTNGGAGGGLIGQTGSIEGNTSGGTQSTGFAQLQGGAGQADNDGGGGAGSGWYGGNGGAGTNSDAQGAGGGSGFVVGTALVSELLAGDRGMAGNASSRLRGIAGNATVAGKVVLECLAIAPPQ